MKKKINSLFWLCIIIIIISTGKMNAKEKETHIVIETSFGDIEVKLYNETPQHRDNIIRLIEEDAYDNQIFHRVIKDFMIQGGDVKTQLSSINKKEEALAYEYTVPAEVVYPAFFHKRGAFAAARLGDNVNPDKASSSSQFYIVTGALFSDQDLDLMEKNRYERLKQSIFNTLNSNSKEQIKELYRSGDRGKLTELRDSLVTESLELASQRKSEILFTDAQRNAYKTDGGSPHLDGDYTVFGEVVSGMDVVDQIQQIGTSESDKPITDIRFSIFLKKE